MPSIGDLAEKIKSSLPGFLRAGGPGALIRGWEDKLWSLAPGFAGKLPWLKGKLVPLLGILSLVLISAVLVLIFSLASAGPAASPNEGPAEINFGPAPIPREELFLREEPDFLPPVILERERREAWTEDEAMPFWYDPLEDGEELWRERVEELIDDLLERVP
jgi:hypothetical protein